MATAARARGGHKLPVAAGGDAAPAALLHSVGGIKDYRAAGGLQLGQAAVLHHQGVAAKAGAVLGEPEPAAARLQAAVGQLGHHLGNVPRRQELAFLHVHHLRRAGHGLGASNICLPPAGSERFIYQEEDTIA